MSRYPNMFARLAAQGEGAFGAFLMLGDPDLPTSAALLDALVAGGSDMIEVGIPFSDPIADGPIVQAAGRRALASGVTIANCMALISDFRSKHSEVPIGILTYANLAVAGRGFMHDAAEAGADSLLLADVPAMEAEPFVRRAEQAGIEPVLIAAANTPDAALARIAATGKAYTYCVSRAGVTGTDREGQFDPELVRKLKAAGSPPPIFGFGISRSEHVQAALAAGAAGAISGSAIINAAVESHFSPDRVAALVSELKAATIRCAA